MANTFWNLHKSRMSSRHFAEWDHDQMAEAYEIITCPMSPKDHMHPGKRLLDLHVVLPDVEVEDFVWTWQSECMVQEHVLELFRARGFTGFETKPVTARFEKSSKSPPRLWELCATGWGGLAPPESGIHITELGECPGCGINSKYSGLSDPSRLIDQSQRDGSDIFMVWPLPKYIFATERVVDAIREHLLTGVYPTEVAKMRKGDMYMPGRLRYYMPEARARELGEPLGIY